LYPEDAEWDVVGIEQAVADLPGPGYGPRTSRGIYHQAFVAAGLFKG
jgi:hypothetical protein